jgi:predicted GNAT family N-acyltransferase
MKQDEIRAVSDLVFRSFKNNVAPYYSEEGVETFLDYANPNAMTARFQKDHFTLIAMQAQALVGMIEIRNHSHISLFFVESLEQQKGIGKALLKKAINTIQKSNPDQKVLTVNSSPNSVEAYKRFGFAPTNSFQEKNGIQFMPMALELL